MDVLKGLEEEIRYWRQQLYYWQYSYTHCFNNMLFDLIAKADTDNINIIRLSYPYAVKVFIQWQESDPDLYFKDMRKDE